MWWSLSGGENEASKELAKFVLGWIDHVFVRSKLIHMTWRITFWRLGRVCSHQTSVDSASCISIIRHASLMDDLPGVVMTSLIVMKDPWSRSKKIRLFDEIYTRILLKILRLLNRSRVTRAEPAPRAWKTALYIYLPCNIRTEPLNCRLRSGF